MTDPSKRYWITEQGIKEAAEDYFASPQMGRQFLIEILIKHVTPAEASPITRLNFRHAVICMDRSCKRCNRIAERLKLSRGIRR